MEGCQVGFGDWIYWNRNQEHTGDCQDNFIYDRVCGLSEEKKFNRTGLATVNCTEVCGSRHNITTKEICQDAASALSWTFRDGHTNRRPYGCVQSGGSLIYWNNNKSPTDQCKWDTDRRVCIGSPTENKNPSLSQISKRFSRETGTGRCGGSKTLDYKSSKGECEDAVSYVWGSDIGVSSGGSHYCTWYSGGCFSPTQNYRSVVWNGCNGSCNSYEQPALCRNKRQYYYQKCG